MPRPPAPAPETMQERIARQMRTEIAAGVLRDGQALPSTRALAQQWGTSTYTASEAVGLLIKEGLVESRDRSGRFVTAPRQRRELPIAAPHLLLIGGYAGSGKTELGRILARATGWPMLDKDTLTRPVVEMALEALGDVPHTRESEVYLSTVRPAEYEALMAAVRENLECGTSVIATAPFLREMGDPAWLQRVRATCTAIGASMHLAWIDIDADSMHTYVRRRGAARDAAKLADWPTYLAATDLDFRPAGPHTVINNRLDARPLEDQAAELLAAITAPAEVE